MKKPKFNVRVKALRNVCIGVGTYLNAGETGEMDSEDAAYLVECGAVTMDIAGTAWHAASAFVQSKLQA